MFNWNKSKPTGKELLAQGSGVEMCTIPGHGGYPKNTCWHCLYGTVAEVEEKKEEKAGIFNSLNSFKP